MYIGLPGKGGIWIERMSAADKPALLKEGGEWLLWIGGLHAVLTPPWWQPKRSLNAS